MPLGLGPILDAELSTELSALDLSAPDAPSPRVLFAPELTLRQAREQLAALLSDEAPKRSRAYKSAYRAAERYMPAGGRRATRPTRAKARRLTRVTHPRLRELRAHGANMKIEVLWYQAKRKWERLPPGPGRWVEIGREMMRRVIRLWEAGETEEAADALFVEFAQNYGIPNPADWLRGVEVRAVWLRPR